MADEGRLSEVRVERRDLGWIGNVDGRREGRKTRRNSGVWEEITRWRIVKERKLLKCRVRLVAILRWSLLILSYSKIIYYRKFENFTLIIISLAFFDQFMKIA